LGIPKGVTRLISSKDSEREQYDILRSGYLIAFGGAVVLTSVVYTFRTELASLMRNPDLTPLITAFLPLILLFPISRVSIAALRAQQKSLQMALTKNIVPRASAIIVFLGYASVQRPFDGAIAYWLVVPLASALLALAFLYHNLSAAAFRARLPDVDVARELWSFSWPLAIGASLILLMSNLDVLMIGYFLQSNDVGFYRSVQPLRQITHFVLQSFVFLFLPLATTFYSRGEHDQLRRLYTTASKWVAVLTLPFVLVFSLFAGDVVRVFFGIEYLPGAPALSILTAGLFFNALVGPNGAMIQALNQSKLEMYAAIVGVVVNIVLNVVLIPQFGIVGAAVATVVGYVMFNIVEVSAIYWISGAHPFSLNTLKPLTLTTVVGVGIARVMSPLSLDLLALIGIGILFLIVQAIAVVATRSLEESDAFIYQQALDRIK
jgi:O-antigen/teichoic acid export membrane protein